MQQAFVRTLEPDFYSKSNNDFAKVHIRMDVSRALSELSFTLLRSTHKDNKNVLKMCEVL